MGYIGPDLTFVAPVTSQAVGREHKRLMPFRYQCLDEESLGRNGVFAFLNQDVDDGTTLVDSTPQITVVVVKGPGDFIMKATIFSRPVGCPRCRYSGVVREYSFIIPIVVTHA